MNTHFVSQIQRKKVFRQRGEHRELPSLDQDSSGPVIWGIDPNEKDVKQVRKVWDILNLWTYSEFKIRPVTVLSPLDFGWPMKITAKFRSELMARANEKSEKLLGQISQAVQKNQILVSSDLSLLNAVRKFFRYASKTKAEMAVLFARESGANHLTGLGSFSEIAVASAKLPIMILTEKTKIPKKSAKFLLPTDFSAKRKKAFLQTLNWVKRRQGELVLYHKMGPPLAPVTVTSFGPSFDVALIESAWAAEQELTKARGQSWVAEAKKFGVPCRLVLEMGAGSWHKRALEINRKEKSDFMVVAVQRGLWSQTLFGRKIRHLIANTECPIIFIHS